MRFILLLNTILLQICSCSTRVHLNMKQLIVFCFSLFLVFQAHAQYKYSNEFLKIGVDARALAMGNAATASTQNSNAMYWNPANLTLAKGNNGVSLMHAEYFAGIAKFDFGAYTHTIDSQSAVGVSFTRFGIDNILNTLNLIDNQGNVDYSKITTFSAADYALQLGYSRKLNNGILLGGSLKIVHRSIGDFAKAWGAGVDLAVSYPIKNGGLSLVARDITGTFNAWRFNLTDSANAVLLATGNDLPQNSIETTVPSITLGAYYNIKLPKKFNVLVEGNLVTYTDGKRSSIIRTNAFSTDPIAGVELSYNQLIFIRTGFNNFQQFPSFNGNITNYQIQPNAGLGIQLANLLGLQQVNLDYAFTNFTATGDQNGGLDGTNTALYSNIVSLLVQW